MSSVSAARRPTADYKFAYQLPGWCSPGFDDAGWMAIRVASHPLKRLVASMGVPVRRKEAFTPTVLTTPKGETMLDFGQNLAGVMRFKVRGPAGTTVRLRHGEALNRDGNFTMAKLFIFPPRQTPFF